MSAPDTNIDKQKHRHRTMGYGIWLGIAIAVLTLVGLILAASTLGTSPTDVIPNEEVQSG